MKHHFIFAALLCLCAAALVSCGSEAETREESAETVTTTSAVTYLRTDVRPAEAPAADSADEEDHEDEDEYDEDEDDHEDGEEPPAPESGDVTDLTPDRDAIDPKKTYTPDEGDLGTGRQVYAYPMNSIELSVYISPAEGSKRADRLLTGTEVTLYANVDFDHMEYWAYIGFEDGFGWCKANELTEVKPDHLHLDGVELPENRYIHKNYSEGVYFTAADGVEVKASPSEGAETLGVLPFGEDVRAFGDSPEAEGWVFIGASAEYAEGSDGGFGELFGWVYTENGALTDSAETN